jgi:hypothetical protein
MRVEVVVSSSEMLPRHSLRRTEEDHQHHNGRAYKKQISQASIQNGLDKFKTRHILCLLLFSRHSPGINIPCVCMYYMFRPTVANIRYTELLQPAFSLSAIPPTLACLHIGSSLYRYVVYVRTLCYEMY